MFKKYYRNSRWNDENYEKDAGDFVIDEILSQKISQKRLIFNNPSINVGVKFGIIPLYEF